jgi:hypothetical protein
LRPAERRRDEERTMATRPKATKDLKIAQGKRRDAYFDRLRRKSQPRKAAAAPPAPEAPAAE